MKESILMHKVRKKGYNMKRSNGYRIRLVVVGIVAAMVVGGRNAKADFTIGEPTNLGPPVNSSGKEVAPSVSADGLELYFHSNGDIWGTTRAATSDDWGTPVNLGPPVSSSFTEYNPCISGDGLELYFSSNRSGGYGDQDIYVATRMTRESEWDEAVNLGSIVNDTTNDGAPSISADGLELYFQSYNRSGGYGHVDNWVATRTTRDEPWGIPAPLPAPLNTSYRDSHPNISDDGLAFFFDSER
ncbi:MAG: PD40 domain-containing protein, partial [Nitrospirota bacterium]